MRLGMEVDSPAFSKQPPLCSRWQCHGAARASISFALVPDTITEAINRTACGVIWHSTGQKPRDECHRTDVPRGMPLVIHERTLAMRTRERVRESGTRATPETGDTEIVPKGCSTLLVQG